MLFEDLISAQKGKLGEALVDNVLFKRLGVIPYGPSAKISAAHPFDRLCASPDKTTLFIAECKAKAHRTCYPDTGINLRAYRQYKFISDKYNLPIYLFFIDEYEKKIYGNDLVALETQTVVTHKGRQITYPWIQGEIIYFPLCLMITYAEFDEQTSEELKGLSGRNWEYEI